MLRSFLEAENISVVGLSVVPGLSYRVAFWDLKEGAMVNFMWTFVVSYLGITQ